jgi:hypothetical protein
MQCNSKAFNLDGQSGEQVICIRIMGEYHAFEEGKSKLEGTRTLVKDLEVKG